MNTERRDVMVAAQVEEVKRKVEALERRLSGMVDDATKNHATGHAGMYDRARMQLSMGALMLGYAHALIADGDPEKFA